MQASITAASSTIPVGLERVIMDFYFGEEFRFSFQNQL